METLFWRMGWKRKAAEIAPTCLAIVGAVVLWLFGISAWVSAALVIVLLVTLTLRIRATRAITPNGIKRLMSNKLGLGEDRIHFTNSEVGNLPAGGAGWTTPVHLRYDEGPQVPTDIQLSERPSLPKSVLIMRDTYGDLHLVRFTTFNPIVGKQQGRTYCSLVEDNHAVRNPRFHGF